MRNSFLQFVFLFTFLPCSFLFFCLSPKRITSSFPAAHTVKGVLSELLSYHTTAQKGSDVSGAHLSLTATAGPHANVTELWESIGIGTVTDPGRISTNNLAVDSAALKHDSLSRAEYHLR